MKNLLFKSDFLKAVILTVLFVLTNCHFASNILSMPVEGESFVHVLDGDTFILKETGIHYRLFGVDCPETDQPYGDQATQFSHEIFSKEEVTIESMMEDRYGRKIAIVRQKNGVSLQSRLVEEGLAWVDDRYCKQAECDDWRKLQADAQKSGRGFWQEQNPVVPWIWRKRNKG